MIAAMLVSRAAALLVGLCLVGLSCGHQVRRQHSELQWVGSLPADPFAEDEQAMIQVESRTRFPVDPFEVMTEAEITFPFNKPLPDNVDQLLDRDNSHYEHDRFNLFGLDKKTIARDEAAASAAKAEETSIPETPAAEDNSGAVECPFKEGDKTEMRDCPHPNGVCCYNSCCKSGAYCAGTKEHPTCVDGDDNLLTTVPKETKQEAPDSTTDDTASAAPSSESQTAATNVNGDESTGPSKSEDGADAAEVKEAEMPAKSESQSSPSAEVRKDKKRGMAIWMANHNVVTRDPADSSEEQ